MKKKAVTFLTAGILLLCGTRAQTLQEGINHLYAGREKNALKVFEKLLAANPNNVEAIYWLGQTKLETEEVLSVRIKEARSIYEKALQTTHGAPLIKVGMGHVELLAGNKDEARQHFETALTLTRNVKRGDDPVIATAIGRAINDAKGADYKYAVKLLEDAAAKDPKNTETLLQLGNAYRKAGEGTGGGAAFQTYKKALEINPSFAVASFRLAKLFESQRNWELVLQYLHEAISRDPKFAKAYYELYEYYFLRKKFDEAEEYIKKYIESKLPETDILDQYLYAQLCWARKDFNCATEKAEAIVAAMGASTRPKVYRLLADSYFQKADYAKAKKFSDEFFMRKNPDDYTSFDHKLRADIISHLGGSPDEIYLNYIQGAELDTTLADKIEFLKKGLAYFKEKKLWAKQAQLLEKIIELKTNPNINEYFDLMYAYYNEDQNSKSRDVAVAMREKWPDQIFGYEWAVNNSQIIDSVKRDSLYVPDLLKLEAFSFTDTIKYKKQYLNSIKPLAAYYYNAKNKEKAIEYFTKWKKVEPANPDIDKYLQAAQNMSPAKTPSAPASKPGSKPRLNQLQRVSRPPLVQNQKL